MWKKTKVGGVDYLSGFNVGEINNAAYCGMDETSFNSKYWLLQNPCPAYIFVCVFTLLSHFPFVLMTLMMAQYEDSYFLWVGLMYWFDLWYLPAMPFTTRVIENPPWTLLGENQKCCNDLYFSWKYFSCQLFNNSLVNAGIFPRVPPVIVQVEITLLLKGPAILK